MKPELIALNAGEVLFNEGDPSLGLYFIQEGSVEIFRARENIDVTLDILRSGDVIGTFTILSREPRMAGARVKEACILHFYTNEFFKQEFMNIPIWTQSVIKDAVARVKTLNEKLIESKVTERTLQRNIGTVYHHSAQLAYLLAAFMRKTKIVDDLRVPLYPVKDFLIQAEFILLKKFTYIEKIFYVFQEHKLFKIINNQKYVKVIEHPNPELLEDFSNFAMGLAKKGSNVFIPSRFHKWIGALVRISKKFNNLGEFEKTQLSDLMVGELGKRDMDVILEQLCSHKIIEKKEKLIKYSPLLLEKTIMFESIARAIKDITP